VAWLAPIAHDPGMQRWIRSLGFWPSLAIAATAGFVQALGAPPDGWLPAHFLGFVPLVVMALRDRVDWREAGWLGLAGGMGVGLGGFPWIAEMLVQFAGVPWVLGGLGLFGFSLWMAIPYALFAIGLRQGPRRGALGLIWPVALFVALQQAWPNLFPYTPILGFAERPAFLQLAELGGVALVEAFVVLFVLLVSRAILATDLRSALRDASIAVVIPPLLLGYGTWRMRAVDAFAEGAPTIRVGIVQPNVPVGRVGPGERMARLTGPSARAERAGAELIVWPEAGAYPYGVLRPFRHERALGPGRVLVAHRLPTIFGANTRDPGARFGYNTAYLIDAEGVARGRYDKVNLVPLGEAIPLVDPDWVTDRIPHIAHHHAGDAPARFVVERDDGPPVAAGPLICYEDILPGFVRTVAAQPGGIDLFVNVTIDAWYGNSAEPWEHLALAQIRSVEHRVPMVRSVSTGVSAVVDSNGRVTHRVPLRPVSEATLDRYPPESIVADVALPRNTASAPTVFARGGWLFGPACTLGAAVGALVLLERARRRARPRHGATG
jgi:apolipoprotein N-acyltransferase